MHYSALVFASDLHKLAKLLDPYAEKPINKSLMKFFDYEDEQYHDHDTGNPGEWINPNPRWDWYEIGGRWNYQLVTHDGEHVNFCRVRDIDFARSFDGMDPFATHTVITPDGVWHEYTCFPFQTSQRENWFNNFKRNFLLPYFDKYVFLIDYHY